MTCRMRTLGLVKSIPSAPREPVERLAHEWYGVVEPEDLVAVTRLPERAEVDDGAPPRGRVGRERELLPGVTQLGHHLVDVSPPPSAANPRAVLRRPARGLPERRAHQEGGEVDARVHRELE